MKIVLDLAVSSDGFIATLDGDSGWVSEKVEVLFKQRIKEAGCLVVGSKTFDQYLGAIYPIKGALNIVMSRDAKLTSNLEVVYASSLDQALKIAADHHCKGMLIAGGAMVSKLFLQSGLINEIYLSVHPIMLKQGLRPFGDLEIPTHLKLLDEKEIGEGIIQKHYIVQGE